MRRASQRRRLIATVESARVRAEEGDSVEAIVNDTEANLRLLEDAGTAISPDAIAAMRQFSEALLCSTCAPDGSVKPKTSVQ